MAADCESPSSSLKHRIRSSICFSCCFRSSAAAADDFEFGGDGHPPSLIRSSSTWIRSKAHEIPEIKEKCRKMIARMGRAHHHRKSQSADFRYDPLSYALNFDEGIGDDLDFVDKEFRHRNFSSRLPASPPTTAARRPPLPTAIGVACS